MSSWSSFLCIIFLANSQTYSCKLQQSMLVSSADLWRKLIQFSATRPIHLFDCKVHKMETFTTNFIPIRLKNPDFRSSRLWRIHGLTCSPIFFFLWIWASTTCSPCSAFFTDFYISEHVVSQWRKFNYLFIIFTDLFTF